MNVKISIIAFITFFITSSLCFSQQSVVEKEYLFKNGEIELPGTLTYSEGSTKQPLAIFVHGSGNVDRNGNQLGLKSNANYIKQLSDSLAKQGIAFFKYDKRTSNVNNIQKIMSDLSFDAFAQDVHVIVDSLKKNDMFLSLYLIGHSQGSLVSMLAINENIDGFISVAGPSSRIDETITDQIRKQNGDSIATIVESHFKELKENDSIKVVNPNLLVLFNKPTQPFMKEWMSYDPVEEIRKINIPTLIIQGKKDLQVSVSEAEKLHEANSQSKLVMIDKMNHVLKDIEVDGDNLSSYGTPEFPLSSELVKSIAEFIKN